MIAVLASAWVCFAAPASPDVGHGVPEPHESVLAYVAAVRKNDVPRLLRTLFSRDELAALEQAWDRKRREHPDEQQELQFQTAMGALTAPGAEELILEQARPKLEELRPQLEGLAGMITGMGEQAIRQQTGLDADERERSLRMLASVARLLLENDLSDPQRARRTIGIACSLARTLDLGSLEDVRVLSFGQLMMKTGQVLRASKEVLAVYGVDLDRWLDSFEAETVERSGDRARVRIAYDFLGVSERSELDLVLRDGRWVEDDFEQKFEALLSKP